ncbi:MAG: SUF system NifU family Fe-S cluster assembly protein [Bacilli bacterium]
MEIDANMRREIILDNYQFPENKGLVEDERYLKVRTNNSSCIDDLNIMVLEENGIIKDIRFDGEACAISTSATSIMIKTFTGKTLEEAKTILSNYEAMIEEEPYDKTILGELNVYNEIYKQPNRKKCALLPFKAIHQILESK